MGTELASVEQYLVHVAHAHPRPGGYERRHQLSRDWCMPSTMGKAVARDAAGKRLRMSKVGPDLVLRVHWANLTHFIKMFRDFATERRVVT